LSHVQAHQGINPQTVDEADVFGIPSGGRAVLCSGVLSSVQDRTGATGPIFRRPTSRWDEADILESFLAQFYDDKPAPKQILLSHPTWSEQVAFLGEALSEPV
jgi:excinuclease ABC subunit C